MLMLLKKTLKTFPTIQYVIRVLTNPCPDKFKVYPLAEGLKIAMNARFWAALLFIRIYMLTSVSAFSSTLAESFPEDGILQFTCKSERIRMREHHLLVYASLAHGERVYKLTIANFGPSPDLHRPRLLISSGRCQATDNYVNIDVVSGCAREKLLIRGRVSLMSPSETERNAVYIADVARWNRAKRRKQWIF